MNKSIVKIARQNKWDLLPDNKTHANRLEIASESSNRLYVVAQSKTTGEWQCSCPGWCIKRPGKPRGCKHLTAMKPLLEGSVIVKRIARK